MARTTTFYAKNLGLPVKQTTATTVEVESLGQGRYAVTVDGQRSELESLQLPTGAVSMIIENDSYYVEFDERGDETSVWLRGHLSRFDIADERKLRLRAASSGFTAEGKQTLLAPMPGKVVKVFVKVGDEVKEGQGLVVIEAMKMENELKSPRAGRVTEVLAREGTPVENGARLIVVEP